MTELDQDLSRLENAGLIRVAQLEPELEYLFRHEMIRDAVYSLTLKNNRKELHRATGEAIVALYADRVDDLAAALAYHFTEGDDPDNALKYATLAGDISYRRFANMEAATQYSRALDVAKRHDRHDKLAYLHEHLGHALEHTGRHGEAVSNYEDMRAAARQKNDRPMELQAILLLMTIRATPTVVFDMAAAQALGDEGLKLARELGNRQSESACLWNLSNLNSHTGDYSAAVGYGEQAIAIARGLGDREQLAYSLNDLASFSYINDFKLARGNDALAEARQLWIELGNQPMLADSLSTAARFDMVTGDYDDAIAHAGEALAISEATDNPWGKSYSRFTTGLVYFERGDFDKAKNEINLCIEWGDRAGFIAPRVGLLSDLGVMHGLLGSPEQGISMTEEALNITAASLSTWQGWPLGNKIRLQVMAGDLAGAKAALQLNRKSSLPTFLESGTATLFGEAEYYLAAGEPAKAETDLTAFAIRLRDSSALGYLCVVLSILARAQIAQGKRDEALATLSEARSLAEKQNARWELWQVMGMLAEVDTANRDAHLAQAIESLDFVVAHISDEDLKRSFLNLSAVKALAKP